MTEIRVGVIGSVDSGKSTITGVITKNILDDGRGKARSLILKHPHEKETGRTSSISQHYLKINKDNWNDYQNTDNTSNTDNIYNQEKIINFVDLAGHEKYLKTTINGIKRCLIDYGCIVVGANMGVLHMTREHISLSIALNLPSFVILTKIDEILRIIKISKRLAEEYAKIEFLIEKILFKKKLLRKNKKFSNIIL